MKTFTGVTKKNPVTKFTRYKKNQASFKQGWRNGIGYFSNPEKGIEMFNNSTGDVAGSDGGEGCCAESLEESVLQDIEKDCQMIRKEYGDNLYNALMNYCGKDHDLGNVIYTESGWNDFMNQYKQGNQNSVYDIIESTLDQYTFVADKQGYGELSIVTPDDFNQFLYSVQEKLSSVLDEEDLDDLVYQLSKNYNDAPEEELVYEKAFTTYDGKGGPALDDDSPDLVGVSDYAILKNIEEMCKEFILTEAVLEDQEVDIYQQIIQNIEEALTLAQKMKEEEDDSVVKRYISTDMVLPIQEALENVKEFQLDIEDIVK